MSALRKKGKDVQPIVIEGRAIARSFWGRGWCDHLESFSDFENRLPRGRTYVRNGSVCHLEIKPGRIEAVVSGSELYDVRIDVDKLKPAAWKTVKKQCSGRIGSMLELLQGKLSDQVMAVVADRKEGLFPQTREISMKCSCPDWAVMCKHVAAVLYGVGSRLDDRPELLFLLRDVDAEDLISTEIGVATAATGLEGVLGDADLGHIFDIDLEDSAGPASRAKRASKKEGRSNGRAGAAAPPKPGRTGRPRRSKPTAIAEVAVESPRRQRNGYKNAVRASTHGRKRGNGAADASMFQPTGKSVARIREQLGCTAAELARRLNVTAASVYRWEGTKGPLNLQARPLAALVRLQREIREG